MENNTDSDIVLEGTAATWNLPLTHGDYLGSYSGGFKFRCYLTPTQELEAGRLYRQLLGPQAMLVSEHEGQLGFCLSQLKFRIVEAPPFWASHQSDSGLSGDIPDLEILLKILDAAMRAEKLFKENVAKEREAKLKSAIVITEKRLKEGEEEGGE